MGASIAEAAGPLAGMAVLTVAYGTAWIVRNRGADVRAEKTDRQLV